MQVEVTDLAIEASGELAVALSLNCITGRKKGESNDTRLWFRSTVCFRRGADGWRVFHEHTSVPLTMDGSGKAATDLTP